MRAPTVIIPVFNAFEMLSDCLDALDVHSPDIQVLVIDDASTDLRIQPLLEKWVAVSETRTLLANAKNKGFVFSANRGMKESTGDVILLNSDTLVTPGWYTLLSHCLDQVANIATATPWSNNGEIVSFPDFCKASPVPEDPAKLAQLIADAGTPEYPDLPTAVGFCMAIHRDAIDVVGYFDEVSFGRGYGEENDFCLRAAAAGFKNVLCDNAYVAHRGGGSFSPLGLAPGPGSMQRLLNKHPGYRLMIEDYIKMDPLAGRRQAVIDQVSDSLN